MGARLPRALSPQTLILQAPAPEQSEALVQEVKFKNKKAAPSHTQARAHTHSYSPSLSTVGVRNTG